MAAEQPLPAQVRRRSAPGLGIAWATLLLGASNIASRGLGLLRDVALSQRAGAGGETDAYFAAFQIPDLLNNLLIGGAVTLAFLPLYTRRQTEHGEAAADRLFHTVLGTLTAAMAVGALAIGWFAEALVARLFPGFPPSTLALTAEITRLVAPAQICFAAGGVINATLLARGRFGALALAPLVYNACIIVVGAALYPRLGVRSFGWGVLLGAVLGPLLTPLIDALPRVRLRLRVAPADPEFLGYLWVALPFMIGVSLVTVDEWYLRLFGAALPAGSVSQLSYARKIMLVPVGAIGQALSTAALPLLSRLWAERRLPELERTLQQALGAALFLAVLVAGGTALLATPLVSLAFQRGAFHGSDTSVVGQLLAIQALAIPAWILSQLAVRPFHARGDTWRPMLLGSALVAASYPLYLVLGRRWGVYGLAAASAPAMGATAFATLVLARRLHGAPALLSLLRVGLRACAIAAAAALLAAAALRGLGFDLVRPQPLGPLASTLLLSGGGLLYCAAAALGTACFADRELRGWLRARLAPLWGRLARRR